MRSLQAWMIIIARVTLMALLFVLLSCPPPAEAWDSTAPDKLTLGETTAKGAEALLGRPDHVRKLLFHSDVERWNYFSWTRAGLPADSMVLDFTGGHLVHKRRLPDAVEEREGFVLDFGLGAASAKTTGSRRISASEKAVELAFGWAPRDRLAILIDVLGAVGQTSGQYGTGCGIRFFPVMPWYVQADYMLTTELVYSPLKSYSLTGRGYAVHVGYEFGFWRKGALATELFAMRTHSWEPDKFAPAGTTESLRSTVWGALVKYVWYP